MTVKFVFGNSLLRTWLLLHQTYNLMAKAEDAVFAKEGITSQQHAVLISMKYIDGPVTPSDVAHWLDRNTNTITTLVDRMEKAGLVKRARDLRDRRSVRLVMTKKGKDVLEAATNVGWQAVQEVLGGISEEEHLQLISLLEKVRVRIFDYLNPGEVIKEANIKEAKTKYRA